MSLSFSDGYLFFKCHCDFQAFILWASLFEYSKSCLLPQECELRAVRGTHRGLSGQSLAQLWGVETSPEGCCWGRACPFHGTAHLPRSSSAPVQSDSGDKPADGYRHADRETDCPQPLTARSPVPAHVVLQCLWAVCRDGKEREKDKSLFPDGEMKYGEYSHQTQTEMGKDSA